MRKWNGERENWIQAQKWEQKDGPRSLKDKDFLSRNTSTYSKHTI